MKRLGQGSWSIGPGISVVLAIALLGRPARAAEGPLLVVVEAPPTLDADAAEIRKAIGTELHARTIAPMSTPVEAPSRALIVALDRDRIAMSLRANDGPSITRVIPAPVEHGARLRAIAWLAGNLARDQITPIVADAPTDPTPLATIPSIAPIPTTEPPPASHPETEPPPLSETPTTIEAHITQKPAAPVHWTIGVADGPTVGPMFNQVFGNTGTTWRIDLQHQLGRSGFFSGVALEGTSGNYSPQPLGAMGFIGTARLWARWRFEASFGAGLEATDDVAHTITMSQNSSGNGVVSTISTVLGTDFHPSLYAGGAVAAAHPITESLAAVLRLSAHIATVNFRDCFLSASLGLRYNLL